MKSLDSKSKFNIYSSFTLSNDDVNVLSLLYAPLIGSDAFTLYMAFQSLIERDNLKSEELIHEDFFEIYSFKSSLFTKARELLEAIGLLITYKNIESGNYVYLICPPLSAKNFIKDVTLGLYLSSKVRRETFDYIVSHFKIEKVDKTKYENISKSFDEVFKSDISNDTTAKKLGYYINKKPNKGVKIRNNPFDFEEFLKNINTDFLEFGVSDSFKKQITTIAFVYKFNESDMERLYGDSINKRGVFDYKLLKKACNNLFVYRKHMNSPKLELKNNEESIDDFEEFLNNCSGEELLDSIIDTYPNEYLTTLTDLYTNIELPVGVINCMVIKAMKLNDYNLPGLNYFKKMYKTWLADNILDTKSAMKYITGELEEDNKPKKESNGFTGFEVL